LSVSWPTKGAVDHTEILARHQSELLVLDGTDLSTVCRALLPHPLPQSLHGVWIEA
jgi:carotenoid cleavage dioxygenase-like enzyme